jgi:hypothetical protein
MLLAFSSTKLISVAAENLDKFVLNKEVYLRNICHQTFKFGVK